MAKMNWHRDRQRSLGREAARSLGDLESAVLRFAPRWMQPSCHQPDAPGWVRATFPEGIPWYVHEVTHPATGAAWARR